MVCSTVLCTVQTIKEEGGCGDESYLASLVAVVLVEVLSSKIKEMRPFLRKNLLARASVLTLFSARSKTVKPTRIIRKY